MAHRFRLKRETKAHGYELEGTFEGLAISVRQGTESIEVRICGASRLDHGVRVSGQWFTRPRSTELQLGEEGFDTAHYLEGDDDAVAAMLSAEARAALRVTRRYGVVVEDGGISVSLSRKPPPPVDFVRLVEECIAVFRALDAKGRSVPERLLFNASHDHVLEVRKTNLRLLLTHHGQTEEGQRGIALAEKLGGTDLRILAARYRRDGAAAALGSIVRDASLSTADRLRAIDAAKDLGETFDAELEAALVGSSGEVEGALAELVGQRGLDSLYPLLLARAEGKVGAAAIGYSRAFGHFRRRDAEPRLIAFLGDRSAEADEVQTEAARALAHVGTAIAVQPLLALTTGLLRPTALKSAARHAVAEVQSRLQGGDAGDLSLATPGGDAGELSLTGGSGDVSLADHGDG